MLLRFWTIELVSLFPDLVREDDRLASFLYFGYGPNVKLSSVSWMYVCGSFLSISKKMLEDHLHGGKYAESLPGKCFCSHNQCQSQTRFWYARQAYKLKPKSLDMYYEGIIMFYN